MLRICLVTSVAVSLVAFAPGSSADEASARKALAGLAPAAKVESVRASPVAGFDEVVVDGQVLYVSRDGEHVFTGELWRAGARENLTDVRKAALRRDAFAAHGSEKRIVFAAAKPRHTVEVFTDFDCGYCRKLHQEIAKYNELGISVEYVLYPRGGPASPSFDRAVSVWCAADRKQAFTAAKLGTEPEHKVCPNPIPDSFALAARAGVTGTPTVFDDEGRLVGTYMTPEQMLARLDATAAP